jgi:hypothetical protein
MVFFRVVFPEILDMNPYISAPVKKESQKQDDALEKSEPGVEQTAVAEVASVDNSQPVVSINGDEPAPKTDQPQQVEMAPAILNGGDYVEPASVTDQLQETNVIVVNGKDKVCQTTEINHCVSLQFGICSPSQ